MKAFDAIAIKAKVPKTAPLAVNRWTLQDRKLFMLSRRVVSKEQLQTMSGSNVKSRKRVSHLRPRSISERLSSGRLVCLQLVPEDGGRGHAWAMAITERRT